ncbi:thiol-disulfide isomerase/thioredoxin [Pedobacter sp. CG_S7]|uniref:thioredoxin family protein n=1 Tax=Pedobacter sp. CG_S7 TaxID=3143930 RepID=UPI0033922B5C
MVHTANNSNDNRIKSLKLLILDKQITIVWGAWCSDSQLHVPHFYKVLEALAFPKNQVTLINVDRDKKSDTYNIDHLNIERVPTFIIFESGKELGRIVENPNESFEADLLHLLTTK